MMLTDREHDKDVAVLVGECFSASYRFRVIHPRS